MSIKIKGMASLESNLDPSRFADKMESALEKTTEFGADVVRDVVQSSGTDRTWSSPWYGRTGSGKGRIDTGEMLNSVGEGPVIRRGTDVQGSFGWTKGSPAYTLFQEYGFRHALSGEVIAGMHSLQEASRDATDEAVELLTDAVNDLLKGK